jgi:MFS family permease
MTVAEAIPDHIMRRRTALRFVLLVGVLSFFADFTYEGSRSIVGPFLGSLGASGLIVALVAGVGELLGYGLRLVSGRWVDRTGLYWPTTIVGYILQMAAVPALALAGSWPVAALLVIAERVGKATRNPPRDVMLSYAAKDLGGYGWTFGLHEALDQAGAFIGPLVVAAILARHGSYRLAFAALLIPAILNILMLGAARFLYPRPRDLDQTHEVPSERQLSSTFWLYLAAAALVAAGFADYPIIAFHFARTGVVPRDAIAFFYAVAMAVSGAGSLIFGRLFDRFGFPVLMAVTVVSALFAPLVFLGGFWPAFAGMVLWGLGVGVQESIIPAAVAPMLSIDKRASGFGLFTAGYGLFWFLGSAAIGFLYDRSLSAVVAFCVVIELAALPLLAIVGRRAALGKGLAK